MRAIWSRWRRSSRELTDDRAAMEEEMRFHIDMAAARYRRAGLSNAEAARRAAADFGGRLQQQEAARDDRRAAWLDILAKDVRFAFRTLRRNAGFTLAVVATMALGISGAAAMFSIIYDVLLRPLPVPAPGQLTYIGWDFGRGHPNTNLAPYEFDFLRRNAHGLVGITAYNALDLALTRGTAVEDVAGLAVSEDFFRVFAQSPALGRAFAPEEWTDSSQVAVITNDAWTRDFGGDPAVLAHPVLLAGRLYRIVGVMPAGFRVPGISPAPTVLVPLHLDPDPRDEGHNYEVLARRRVGVTDAALRAELTGIGGAMRGAHPELFDTPGEGFAAVSFDDVHVGPLGKQLWLLFAAVCCLLLVATVNSANLWIARALAREHEMVVRVAIGAGRSRLVRQLITESILLCAAAGATGLVIGWWALHVAIAHAPIDIPRRGDISFWPAAAASTFFIAGAGVLFGLFAALPSFRLNLASALGQRAQSSGGVAHRLRAGLVAAEVALAVVMVSSAGLLLLSFHRLGDVDKGFATEGVWAVRIARLPAGYDATQRAVFARTLLDRIRALPGVHSAGTVANFPLERGLNFVATAEGNAAATDGAVELRGVSPGAMQALSVRLRSGRLIDEQDLQSGSHVAVVSRGLAVRFFGTANVLGRAIDIGRWRGQWLGVTYQGPTTIVGVVDDVRDVALDQRPRHTIYMPEAPGSHGRLRIVLSAHAIAPREIAAIVREIDPTLEPPVVEPLSDVVGASVAVQRFQTVLLAAFGAASLLLAAIGVFGIVAYAMQQRSREIGIRVALGATRPRLVRLVLRNAMAAVVMGGAAGILLAVAASRLLAASLFHVSPTDPAVLAAAVGLLFIAALAACIAPARRALHLDPIEVLRS